MLLSRLLKIGTIQKNCRFNFHCNFRTNSMAICTNDEGVFTLYIWKYILLSLLFLSLFFCALISYHLLYYLLFYFLHLLSFFLSSFFLPFLYLSPCITFSSTVFFHISVTFLLPYCPHCCRDKICQFLTSHLKGTFFVDLKSNFSLFPRWCNNFS